MTAHARLSPSAASRWINCIASARPRPKPLEEGGDIPVVRKAPWFSPAASRGTLLHSHVAEALTGASRKIGLLDDESREVVEYAVGAIRAIFKSRTNPRAWIEQRVRYSDLIYGTADAIILSDGCLDVIDVKTGTEPVEAVENMQMAVYSLAALKSGFGSRYDDVYLTIIQGGATKVWKIPDGWLADLEQRIQAQITKLDTNPTETHGGSWCRWCPHRNECPDAAMLVDGTMLVGLDTVPRTTQGG